MPVDVGVGAYVKRQGNTLIAAPKLWRNMDGQQVAARIIREYETSQRYEAQAHQQIQDEE